MGGGIPWKVKVLSPGAQSSKFLFFGVAEKFPGKVAPAVKDAVLLLYKRVRFALKLTNIETSRLSAPILWNCSCLGLLLLARCGFLLPFLSCPHEKIASDCQQKSEQKYKNT